ncbi:MAG TPA: hypothetical protein VFW44_13715, partial [Bryobacteraceae bacterium]|nr:hypothetical protein [Bryobacteraceae bacterium]
MGGLNIRRRIWLSIGIFVIGYSFSVAANYVSRLRSERDFSLISDALVPAAQNGHSARNAFLRLMKGYEDYFLMRDSTGLERAALEGQRVMECLNAVAGSQNISPARSAATLRLLADMQRFLAEASATYPRAGEDIPPQLELTILHLGREASRLEGVLTA